MYRSRFSFHAFFGAFVFCCFGTAALGAVQLSSRLNTRKWVVGDALQWQIEVEGADPSAQLLFPSVSGLSFQQAGPPAQSSQTFWINGTKTSHNSLTYSVSITADKPGHYALPSAIILYQGRRYLTKTYQVQAVQGQVSDLMKLTVSSDKKKVYLGEQVEVTLTWELHQQIASYQLHFPLLDQKDALKLHLKSFPPNRSTKDLSLGNYRVRFLAKALPDGGTTYSTTFLIQPDVQGTLNIPAGHLKAMITQGYRTGRDVFGRLVRQPNLVAQYSHSVVLSLPVLPLPTQGRPANFTGAVGQFQFVVTTKGRSFEVGEPIVLQMVIQGKGNLDKIERPVLVGLDPGFKVDESLAPGELQKNQLVFTQTIRATKKGQSQIGPLSLVYFDPAVGRYKTAESAPMGVSIKAAQKLQLTQFGPPKAMVSPAASAAGPVFLSENPPPTELPFWVWLLGLGAITGLFLRPKRIGVKKEILPNNAPPFERSALSALLGLALEPGLKQLVEKTQLLLSWRFGPQRQWNGEAIQRLVQQGLVSTELAERLGQVLYEAEAALYAGGRCEQEGLNRGVQQLIEVYQTLVSGSPSPSPSRGVVG